MTLEGAVSELWEIVIKAGKYDKHFQVIPKNERNTCLAVREELSAGGEKYHLVIKFDNKITT